MTEAVNEMSGGESDKKNGPYKVVELSTVTDETMEEALNEWTAKEYELDSVHFAMREGSRRPSMAFLVFGKENK